MLAWQTSGHVDIVDDSVLKQGEVVNSSRDSISGRALRFSDVADDFEPKIRLFRKRRKYPPIVNRLSFLCRGGIYSEYNGMYIVSALSWRLSAEKIRPLNSLYYEIDIPVSD